MEGRLSYITNNQKKINKLYFRSIIGYILLVVVILLTVLSAVWVQKITDTVKPFCLTYINYSFLTILIFVHCGKNKIKNCKKKKVDNLENSYEDIAEQITDDSVSETFAKVMVDNRSDYSGKFHIICIILMTFWYFGNAFYNLGLSVTSITSSNTIANVNIVFIFLIKMIFFKSKCSLYKIIGLIFCIAGIILMAIFDATARQVKKEDSIIGDLYIIVSALFYSFYAISIKYYSKKHRFHFDVMEVFGYIGLYNMLLIPFVLIVLHIFGVESIAIPKGNDILLIFINAVVAGIVGDLIQSYCITLLSPHIVSFGLTLTIPLSYLWDFFNKNIEFHFLYIVGSILIYVAFSIILYENYIKYKKKKEQLELLLLPVSKS